MIKISKQADYAFQFIFELSKLESDVLLSLKKFSLQSSISFLFLQKIAKNLREANIIKAVKGKAGGYLLAKPADKISVKEVIDAVDGPYSMMECAKTDHCCEIRKKCKMRHGLEAINRQMIKYFEKLKVTDLSK